MWLAKLTQIGDHFPKYWQNTMEFLTSSTESWLTTSFTWSCYHQTALKLAKLANYRVVWLSFLVLRFPFYLSLAHQRWKVGLGAWLLFRQHTNKRDDLCRQWKCQELKQVFPHVTELHWVLWPETVTVVTGCGLKIHFRTFISCLLGFAQFHKKTKSSSKFVSSLTLKYLINLILRMVIDEVNEWRKKATSFIIYSFFCCVVIDQSSDRLTWSSSR